MRETVPRYLFGPVSPGFADQHLRRQRERGDCLVFDHSGDADLFLLADDSWEAFSQRFPSGWWPDFLCVHLAYRTMPRWMWQAPVPIVGLAGDWNLQWHWYRRCLPRCDLVLADPLGVEVMQAEGIRQARSATLFGCERAFAEYDHGDGPRDIDILFVGNFHPAVQHERLPWLGRVAKLAKRWNVVLASGVHGNEYRKLLGRARIVFNRSIRGEANNRAFEAAAAGALLFQEAKNRELRRYFRDRQECVYYTDQNLEDLLAYYLEHEKERAYIAQAAGRSVLTFESLWDEQTATIERAIAKQREQTRTVISGSNDDLIGRAWQASASLTRDSTLVDDLRRAVEQKPSDSSLHNALGIALAIRTTQDWPTATGCFQTAWQKDPSNVVAGLNLAEVLHRLGQNDHAIEQCRRTLAMVDLHEGITACAPDGVHFPVEFDLFRVEWERAAWMNAGDPAGEIDAKRRLVRARLHTLLAGITDDLAHFYEACQLCPDLPQHEAALGCALGRKGRFEEAIPHLQLAVAGNPFDIDAARALYHALGQAGQSAGQATFARGRRILHEAASGLVPAESWFAERRTLDPTEKPTTSARIVWQGSVHAMHSLAHVNREMSARLCERGHDVYISAATYPDPPGTTVPLPLSLRDRLGRVPSGDIDVHVAHQWPPDFAPPGHGHWVMMQPWEFGALPKAWLRPMSQEVDEVWVPSNFVRDGFVRSGLPADAVHVIPNGVSRSLWESSVPPLPLPTRKRFKFFFVGGTLDRKGIDLLLKAYTQVFSDKDDVCLVVKDMGVGTFYQGQTAEQMVAQTRQNPRAPEIEYLNRELSEEELIGLFRACDCLVHPFRGEGFGLPIVEAMALGLPVIVTGYGPTLDYCTDETAYLLPARVVPFRQARVGDIETVIAPWWAEPDQDALRFYLRRIFEEPAEATEKGRLAAEWIRGNFTWEHSIACIEERLDALRGKSVRRLRRGPTSLYSDNGHVDRPRVSLCMIVKNEEANLADCLESVREVVDEMIVVDTGSTDATRDVAKRLGAKLFEFPWIDNFAAARNESLRHATGDWIFWMDADDRLDDVNRHRLGNLIANLPRTLVGFVMKCFCLSDPESGSETVVDHVRLFPNRPEIRWEHRIHEQILPAIRREGGTVQWADVVIRHVGYVDPAVRRRKRDRDLRLLHMELEEMPDHPFTLFNLGQVYQEDGNIAGALQCLEKSLEKSHPSDSIVRKLYALIAQCQRFLGKPGEAVKTCEAGRKHYPHDPEIGFQEALARHEVGDLQGAIFGMERVLQSKESAHFGSVAVGLQGFKARHNLGVYYRQAGRLREAEEQWRQALREEPAFPPSLVALGDLFLQQERFDDLETVLHALEQRPSASLDASVLRGRAHLARREFDGAKRILHALTERFPDATAPWIFLSHAYLQEARDWDAAEKILHRVLELQPANTEAKLNLDALERSRQRHVS